MNQQRTGYPSIDKSWLKYYSEESINAKLPAKSMYQFIYDENCNHMNDVAMLYMCKKITYKEMFKHIDVLAECFAANGINIGDVVTIISLNTPETFYCFYALNKIGAIACMEYVTQPEELLLQSLNNVKPKMIIILSLFIESFKNAINEYGEKTLVLSPVDTLSVIPRVIGKTNLGLSDRHIKNISIDYRKFY